jgi:hypothetical protein
MLSVMRYMLDIEEESTRRSTTLRWVMKHADLLPLTAIAVLPVDVAALMAYSTLIIEEHN